MKTHDASARDGGRTPFGTSVNAPGNPSACMGAALAQGWWDKAERLAGLEPKPGRGWHSLRRKFAPDLMDQPLKVLCELGGWNPASEPRKFNNHDQMRIHDLLPG